MFEKNQTFSLILFILRLTKNKNWLAVLQLGLLTFALFMSARMGIYQEVIYGKYGKHPKEALYYTHALPLPGIRYIRHLYIVASS